MLDLTYTAPTPKVIAGAKHDWELVIGMEIHAQVSSNAKLFSGASTTFGAEPNSNVAFVDAAMPGMLPVINEFCVEQAVRTGLGLKAQINLRLGLRPQELFLPRPAAGLSDQPALPPHRGRGRSAGRNGPRRRAPGPDRAHPPGTGCGQIDPRHGPDPVLRRFQPHRRRADGDRHPPRHPRARKRLRPMSTKLRQILRYLGTCDGNMQNGNLRADVNVSVCRPGQYEKYQATQDFRPSRHALRDQEHELDAVHPAGHRL